MQLKVQALKKPKHHKIGKKLNYIQKGYSMTKQEKLLAMIEDDPNDRTLDEIGNKLTITPEQVKKIENSIPWHNRGKHKVTFDGKTQTIKGLKFAINFLGHTGEEDIIPVAQKLLDIMKAKSEIKSWKYLNASWLIENNKILSPIVTGKQIGRAHV